jgi:sugar lactone lactonase YvrE
LWSAEERALYWVDIRAPAIRRWTSDGNNTTSWTMPDLVGSIALIPRGRLLVALQSSVAIFDLATETLQTIAAPDSVHADMRCNDGRCDRQGRFWFGTMNNVTRAPEGSLYRLDRDRTCTKLFSGIRIPNSLAWSPDGRTMYFADSLTYAIYRYDFDAATGTPANQRLFARTTAPAIPDGSCVDAQGCLWNAEYGGWRITRYAPDGHVDRAIDLPVANPTSCTFGGPDLDILYVTTATQKLTHEERTRQPLAGTVLAFRPGVTGLPEPFYAD